MRTKQLLFGLMACVTLLVSSCEKEKEKGVIKIAVNYTAASPTSSYVYFLGSQFKVVLKDEWGTTELATQYSSGGTLDFGEFGYGTYSVTVTAREDKQSLTTGSVSSHSYYNQTRTIQLNAPTKSEAFTF